MSAQTMASNTVPTNVDASLNEQLAKIPDSAEVCIVERNPWSTVSESAATVDSCAGILQMLSERTDDLEVGRCLFCG